MRAEWRRGSDGRRGRGGVPLPRRARTEIATPKSSTIVRSRSRLPGRTSRSPRRARSCRRPASIGGAAAVPRTTPHTARGKSRRNTTLIGFAEATGPARGDGARTWRSTALPGRCAVALRLIDLGWFRSRQRYAASRAFGITTLRKRHVALRGTRVSLPLSRASTRSWCGALVDAELAERFAASLACPAAALRTSPTARDLGAAAERLRSTHPRRRLRRRTSGRGAAPCSPRSRSPSTTRRASPRRRRRMRGDATSARGSATHRRARPSYVCPAVVEQYLDGRTIDDFRPRHLRVVGARDLGLDLEEQSTLSLLRSWRIRARSASCENPRNGTENRPRLRQLRQGSRRDTRRDAAAHVYRRAARLEGRRSLRHCAGQHARPCGRPARPPPEVRSRLDRSPRAAGSPAPSPAEPVRGRTTMGRWG